ncbi:MAG TPA: hypothetical protein P5076_25665, partial [Myxococcota bacterium]|nr:hypothetical protein [Myxococcota bacterium]
AAWRLLARHGARRADGSLEAPLGRLAAELEALVPEPDQLETLLAEAGLGIEAAPAGGKSVVAGERSEP